MNNRELTDRLEQVFDKVRDGRLPEGVDASQYDRWKQDFVFHMTDWLQDMNELRDLFENPTKYEADSACILVSAYLFHVIPHLNAAGRLLWDEIADPFRGQPR